MQGETVFDPWWGWSGAAASYYQLHPETNLPSIGVIYFTDRVYTGDDEHWNELIHQRAFYNIAMHEMGHVLGIGLGPQWEKFITPGLKKYSHFQGENIANRANNFFTGPNAWQALKRQPIHLARLWVGNDGNPNQIAFHRPFLHARYKNILSRIIGTYEKWGEMEELYTYIDQDTYIGIGNAVPINNRNIHWGSLILVDYMSDQSLIPGQLALRTISEVSAGALHDMGYIVNYEKAIICPKRLRKIDYIDYLDPDFAEYYFACTWTGNYLGIACDDPEWDHKPWEESSGKVVVGQSTEEYPFSMGQDIKPPGDTGKQ